MITVKPRTRSKSGATASRQEVLALLSKAEHRTITPKDAAKILGKPIHPSNFYSVRKQLGVPNPRTGTTPKKASKGATTPTPDAAGDAKPKRGSGAPPFSKIKREQRDQEFMAYLLWQNAGLRKGWFDFYVTADTTDLGKLRAAFDAHVG